MKNNNAHIGELKNSQPNQEKSSYFFFKTFSKN